MSFTYTTNIPASGNNPSSDQPKMQTNFNSINSIIGVDHNSFSSATAGYHNVIHFSNQGSNPGSIAGVGQLYTKTVSSDQQLFYESGGGTVTQLTANATATANGSLITQGMTIKWGTFTGLGHSSSGTAVTFPVAFASNCFSIVLTPIRASTSNVDTLYVKTGTLTTSGVTIINTSSSITSCYYVAIGN